MFVYDGVFYKYQSFIDDETSLDMKPVPEKMERGSTLLSV